VFWRFERGKEKERGEPLSTGLLSTAIVVPASLQILRLEVGDDHLRDN
jgi:hypothetical protein